MALRALAALSVADCGPTTAAVLGAAFTGAAIGPSAAAGWANVATRPPEAATIAAPFTAGCADSLAMSLSSESGL